MKHQNSIFGYIESLPLTTKEQEAIQVPMGTIAVTEFEDKDELADYLISKMTPLFERDSIYDTIASKILLSKLYRNSTLSYGEYLEKQIERGKLSPNLIDKFDVEKLEKAIVGQRDDLFSYISLAMMVDKFLHTKAGLVETPQMMWMRVAQGIALTEKNPTKRAIEFYDMMSTLRFIPSTPTLMNAGLKRTQLSSCFLNTVDDNLESIFDKYYENALLSRWGGGVATDFSNLRASGSEVKSLDINSNGVVPFLKIVDSIVLSINRGGKRTSAVAVYLENWHLDFLEFLDLRKNTGDDRRRTRDLHTASWVSDLFMERVEKDEDWTLFSPSDTPDLHHLYGREFKKRYEEYERMTGQEITNYRRIKAVSLWRKMLTSLYETGHPFLTFKDPSNIANPQKHVGTIHSSNLCTEILLNTTTDQTAVCNLGSVNLSRHVTKGVFESDKLAKTIETATRMLDNVIDINYYPTETAERANKAHRPVGLGVLGFQDMIFEMGESFESKRISEITNEVFSKISYYTIMASARLAKERGSYSTFKGSAWSKGILPIDTIDMIAEQRIEGSMSFPAIPISTTHDWDKLRKAVKRGMRNSLVMAIAPTATISLLSGTYPSIEPLYTNYYVKSNMSGEFLVVNKYLVRDLEKLGLWTTDIIDKIKVNNGSIQTIEEIPEKIRVKFKTCFEIDPLWLVHLNAIRARYIDQAQSFNVFLKNPSGKSLDTLYRTLWRYGIKTSYYLRSQGVSGVEKASVINQKEITQSR